MIFTPRPRYPEFSDTLRKRAALRRRQQAERDAFPLFADVIAKEQPSEDIVMANRAALAAETEANFRIFHAQQWRKVRAEFYRLTRPQRVTVRLAIKSYSGPKNQIAYAYLIRRVKAEVILSDNLGC